MTPSATRPASADLLEELLAQRILVGPLGPVKPLRDWRDVALILDRSFEFEVAVDLEEQEPPELADALGVAIDAGVLAHDVLNGLDGGGERHSVGFLVS